MTDTTEAEARRWTYLHMTTTDPAEDGIWRAINDRIGWGYSGVGGIRESQANDDVRDAIEHLRATEREKVRALVERVVSKRAPNPCACGYTIVGGRFEDWYTPHTEDCPWVEARLWLDGGAK